MKAVNAGQAMAVALADELARCGMTDVCVAPGSRSAPLALAFAADPRFRLHVGIDERSVSFLALGMAKASGRPVAVVTTSGTAVGNLHPAVLEAHHSRVPLVLLTADRPPELRDAGAGQTIDQVRIFGNSVRWFCEVGVPEARLHSVGYWRSVACRAYHSAAGRPAGPVHLNCAFRDPLVPVPDEAGFDFDVSGRADGSPWTQSFPPTVSVDNEVVARLSNEISSTERGLIVIGTCDFDPSLLVALAQAAGWPVIAEATSNARTGAAISTYDALLRDDGFANSHRPDVVLRFGRLGISKSLTGWLDPSTRQIAVDSDGLWLDPARGVAWNVGAEPAQLCKQLIGSVKVRTDSQWQADWLAAEATARAALDAALDEFEEVTEPCTARDLAALLPDGSNLAVASSMPVRDLDWFMAPRSGLRVFANRGVNGIDGFVSTALGIAFCAEGPTAALLGDLALLHDQNGLLHVRADGIDAVLVVVNNDGGGIFSFLPQADQPENFELLFGTPHGVDLHDVARVHGCGFTRLERAGDLEPALKDALATGGLHIIEARTDRAANVDIHQNLWRRVSDDLRKR